MRFLLTVSALVLFMRGVAQQDSLTIRGTLKGHGNEKINLTLIGGNTNMGNYSVNARNDVFQIRVKKQQQPVLAKLHSQTQIESTKKSVVTSNGKTLLLPSYSVFLEFIVFASDIEIKGDVNELPFAKVKGDKLNEDFSRLKKSTEKQERRQEELRKSLNDLKESDSVERGKLFKEYSANSSQQRDVQKKFIADHPQSFVSLLLLSRMETLYTAGDYENAYNQLADDYKYTSLAKGIERRNKYLAPTAPGKPAIPFVRKDKDGNEINISDYKGRVVLLDFWGSWCGPCRASHPHLKELYSKYKDRGFEIIAIADEKAKTPEAQKTAWLAAIEKDGITWVHILNNDGVEKQNMVKDYHVSEFPTKILLDKEGKIVLRISGSGTDDIDKALERIYGQ